MSDWYNSFRTTFRMHGSIFDQDETDSNLPMCLMNGYYIQRRTALSIAIIYVNNMYTFLHENNITFHIYNIVMYVYLESVVSQI